jgi:hypothetical protein
VILVSVSKLKDEETVTRTGNGVSSGVVNARHNGEKRENLNIDEPAAKIKDGAWNGVIK